MVLLIVITEKMICIALSVLYEPGKNSAVSMAVMVILALPSPRLQEYLLYAAC